jgi:mannosyl-glycoprotein endo-beta-N-acetylglucosaminidase
MIFPGYLNILRARPTASGCSLARLPGSRTGPAVPVSVEKSPVSVSHHYARLLAYLAHQRGFDGYLLNFEWHLRADSGIGHTRALTAWVSLLQAELKAKVGPHAEVIW